MATVHGLFTGRNPEEDDSMTNLMNSFMSLVPSLMGQVKMAPVFVGVYFGTGSLMYGSQNFASRGSQGLYSLITKVLWFCSAPMMEFLPAAGQGLSDHHTNFVSAVESNMGNTGLTTYSLATSTYELVVGPGTIIAYGVLGGLVLLFCMVALAVSMRVTSGTGCLPLTTAYVDVDYRRLNFDELDHVSRD